MKAVIRWWRSVHSLGLIAFCMIPVMAAQDAGQAAAAAVLYRQTCLWVHRLSGDNYINKLSNTMQYDHFPGIKNSVLFGNVSTRGAECGAVQLKGQGSEDISLMVEQLVQLLDPAAQAIASGSSAEQVNVEYFKKAAQQYREAQALQAQANAPAASIANTVSEKNKVTADYIARALANSGSASDLAGLLNSALGANGSASGNSASGSNAGSQQNQANKKAGSGQDDGGEGSDSSSSSGSGAGGGGQVNAGSGAGQGGANSGSNSGSSGKNSNDGEDSGKIKVDNPGSNNCVGPNCLNNPIGGGTICVGANCSNTPGSNGSNGSGGGNGSNGGTNPNGTCTPREGYPCPAPDSGTSGPGLNNPIEDKDRTVPACGSPEAKENPSKPCITVRTDKDKNLLASEASKHFKYYPIDPTYSYRNATCIGNEEFCKSTQEYWKFLINDERVKEGITSCKESDDCWSNPKYPDNYPGALQTNYKDDGFKGPVVEVTNGRCRQGYTLDNGLCYSPDRLYYYYPLKGCPEGYALLDIVQARALGISVNPVCGRQVNDTFYWIPLT